MEFLYEVEIANDDIHSWQEPISILWRDMRRLPLDWGQPELVQLAEELLHQARFAISESVQRQYYRYKYQLNSRNYWISELNARLSAINNRNKAIELLGVFLPLIGIRYFQVALFEPNAEDRVARSVIIDAGQDFDHQRFPFPEPPIPATRPVSPRANIKSCTSAVGISR